MSVRSIDSRRDAETAAKSHVTDILRAGLLGGFMSHFFYAMPLALVVKRLASTADG